MLNRFHQRLGALPFVKSGEARGSGIWLLHTYFLHRSKMMLSATLCEYTVKVKISLLAIARITILLQKLFERVLC